jgi:hypothetical protein
VPASSPAIERCCIARNGYFQWRLDDPLIFVVEVLEPTMIAAEHGNLRFSA